MSIEENSPLTVKEQEQRRLLPAKRQQQIKKFFRTRSHSLRSLTNESVPEDGRFSTETTPPTPSSVLDITLPRSELSVRYSLHPSPEGSDSEYDTDMENEVEKEIYDPTGCSVYISACERNNIVPIRHVLNNLTKSTIKMINIGLGPIDVLALSMPLLTNMTVTELDLSENRIESDGLFYLTEMLKENVCITDLRLANNNLASDGAVLIGEIIAINTTIRNLDISGNKFTDSDVIHIAGPLKKSRLRSLNISYNEFREEGGKVLAPVIAENDMLEELDLSWNHFRLKGAVAIAKGIKENVGIHRLDLSWNGFSNNGALAISRALKENRTLQELDLSCNRINVEGIVHICKALEKNDTLEVLKVNQNSIGTKAAEKLLETIAKSATSRIQHIEFTDTEVARKGMLLIREIQTKNANFEAFFSRSVYNDDPYGKKVLEKDAWFGNPLRLLIEYMRENNFRVMDLFKEFDRDGSWTVTLDEFRKGVKLAKIPLSDLQLEQLIEQLDDNNNGEIDFSEMVLGHRKFKSKERRRRIQNEMLEKLRSDVSIESPTSSPMPVKVSPMSSAPSSPRPKSRQSRPLTPIATSGNSPTSMRSSASRSRTNGRGSSRRVSRVQEVDENENARHGPRTSKRKSVTTTVS
ncbi:uncharacterized protein LOC141907456 [Tubulanus polymorphus]|uniref:uncharacterized protein LOC141907456 n=1 Tax=Tubulanus polymorphus TaxID=672921 RepID=UPI003DA1DF58